MLGFYPDQRSGVYVRRGLLALPPHRCTKDKLSANVYSKRFSPACINTLLGAVKFIMNKKILKRIEEIFAKKLQAKTGWGRNEIMQAYREAVNEALMEMLDD